MAWSHLQGVGANSAAAATIPVTITTANLSSGSKLIAFVMLDASASQPTVNSVDDGNGNSFTRVDQYQPGTLAGTFEEQSIWVLDTPAGDVGTKPTITAHCTNTSSNAGLGIVVQEVSGLATGSSCLDGTPGHSNTTNSGGTQAVPTYSSSALNEYLVQFYGDWGSGSSAVTVPSGYSGPDNAGVNGNAEVNIGWKNSTNGSETGNWTGVPGSQVVLLTAVAFKLAVPVIPPPTYVVGQGSTPHGLIGPASAPTVTQAVRRGGYY